MNVVWQPEAPRLTVGQWHFSPALLKKPTPELPEYYKMLTFRLKRAINGRGDQADPVMVAALQELENDPNLNWLKEAQHDNC